MENVGTLAECFPAPATGRGAGGDGTTTAITAEEITLLEGPNG